MGDKITNLLKEAGYSEKAIDYYLKKLNVGEIENPDSYFMYTGSCGDTMEIYLKIESGIIKDAKFQAIGCAGAFVSGSALTEMIKGKSLEEAEKIENQEVTGIIGGMPSAKTHCAGLALRTLKKAIVKYKSSKA